MFVIWAIGLVGGLVVATFASRRAVVAALAASEVSRISPGVVGLTVMAVGTDLPEIANSVIAAIGGHGDVFVGDASGSALTQVTFVLALLCFGVGPLLSDPREIVPIGAATVGGLVVASVFVADELFARTEGLVLIGIWIVGLAVMSRAPHDRPTIEAGDRRGAAGHLARTLGWLAVVGGAATVVVTSFVALSESVGVPQLVSSAVVLSLGTSLPELVVDWTAIRRGSMALALGDLFGSSFLDATLALGIGPVVREVTVSSTAWVVCLIAAGGVAVATIVTGARRRHGRRSAVVLLATYVVGIVSIVALAA